MNGYYFLEGKNIIPCDSVEEWAAKFQNKTKRVAETQIGIFRVSTVFLGVDHSFQDDADPILFETMVFSKNGGDYQERCSTYEEAEAMHERICNEVRKKVKDESTE